MWIKIFLFLIFTVSSICFVQSCDQLKQFAKICGKNSNGTSPEDKKSKKPSQISPSNAPLEINFLDEPKHLSRLPEGEVKIKWNDYPDTNHYIINVAGINLDGDAHIVLDDFKPTGREHSVTLKIPGVYRITMAAFKSPDEDYLLDEDTVIIIVTNIEKPSIKFVKPASTGQGPPTIPLVRAGWELEWVAVDGAHEYQVAVIHAEDIIETVQQGPKYHVEPELEGEHIIFVSAWKSDKTMISWGMNRVIVGGKED